MKGGSKHSQKMHIREVYHVLVSRYCYATNPGVRKIAKK